MCNAKILWAFGTKSRIPERYVGESLNCTTKVHLGQKDTKTSGIHAIFGRR